MEYRRLGKTGLQISALSFGSWLTFGKQIDNQTAEDLMSIAYDHGINFFDNAEIYARGRSEIVMGEIFKKKKWDRDTFIVSSKVFFGYRGKEALPTQKGLSRKHVVEACDQALKRLQLDYLDLYFCHRPDNQTPIEETVWTMHNLIQQGKILYWGTSEWSAEGIVEAHRVAQHNHLIGPVVEQPQYNLFERNKMEVEFAQLFKTVGLGATIWSPLASGLLSGKYNTGQAKKTRLDILGMEWLKEDVLKEENLKKVEALLQLSNETSLSLPVLSIAWCLKNENVSTVILGASKTEQLIENLKAIEAQGQLNDGLLKRIEDIMENKPVRPSAESD